MLVKQAELEAVIYQTIAEKNLDLFVFVITDILNNDSVAIALGHKSEAVERAYNVQLVDNKALLKALFPVNLRSFLY